MIHLQTATYVYNIAASIMNLLLEYSLQIIDDFYDSFMTLSCFIFVLFEGLMI